MYRWANCPGSVRLLASLGPAANISSEYAAEGHKAHAVGEYVLRTDMWPTNVAPEMKAAVKVYTDFIGRLTGTGSELLIEHSFDLSSIHPGCFGTSDAVVYQPWKKRLVVADYKHGAGVFVDVPGNMQLQYYGVGSLITLPFDVDEIMLVVAQPRIPSDKGLVRWWPRTPQQLLAFGEDLKRYAQATEDPGAKLVPGPWCMFCAARKLGECPACDEATWQRVRKHPPKTDPRTEFKVIK